MAFVTALWMYFSPRVLFNTSLLCQSEEEKSSKVKNIEKHWFHKIPCFGVPHGKALDSVMVKHASSAALQPGFETELCVRFFTCDLEKSIRPLWGLARLMKVKHLVQCQAQRGHALTLILYHKRVLQVLRSPVGRTLLTLPEFPKCIWLWNPFFKCNSLELIFMGPIIWETVFQRLMFESQELTKPVVTALSCFCRQGNAAPRWTEGSWSQTWNKKCQALHKYR